MRVLVTGAGGQVGRELFRSTWPDGTQVKFVSHYELDISDPEAVRRTIEQPLDLVVNAAAYTAVDRAEDECELAHRVNAEGAGLLASRCQELEIPLIHLSTDYVFDGKKSSPYVEEDEPSPLSVYGASKLAGEAAVRGGLDAHLILRTASVFSEFGQNFVISMLRLSAERPTLGVVADQQSCPTAASDIAAVIVLLAQRISRHKTEPRWGTYHFCGQPPVTWLHFAQRIFELARDFGMATPELRPITMAEYPALARRPVYSALDCSKIAKFGIPIPSWAAQLPSVISAICSRRFPA